MCSDPNARVEASVDLSADVQKPEEPEATIMSLGRS